MRDPPLSPPLICLLACFLCFFIPFLFRFFLHRPRLFVDSSSPLFFSDSSSFVRFLSLSSFFFFVHPQTNKQTKEREEERREKVFQVRVSLSWPSFSSLFLSATSNTASTSTTAATLKKQEHHHHHDASWTMWRMGIRSVVTGFYLVRPSVHFLWPGSLALQAPRLSS